MDLNYRQVFQHFNIYPILSGDFCHLLKSEDGKLFAVYSRKENKRLNCIYLNTLSDLSCGDLYILLCDELDLKQYKQLHPISEDVSEFELIQECERDFILDFAFSLKDTYEEDKPMEKFFNLYDTENSLSLNDISDKSQSDYCLFLKDINTSLLNEILEFNPQNYSYRFSSSFALWKGAYKGGGMAKNVVSFNPFLFNQFYNNDNLSLYFHSYVINQFINADTLSFFSMLSDKKNEPITTFLISSQKKEWVYFMELFFLMINIRSKGEYNFSYRNDYERVHFSLIFNGKKENFMEKAVGFINILNIEIKQNLQKINIIDEKEDKKYFLKNYTISYSDSKVLAFSFPNKKDYYKILVNLLISHFNLPYVIEVIQPESSK